MCTTPYINIVAIFIIAYFGEKSKQILIYRAVLDKSEFEYLVVVQIPTGFV